MDLTREAWHSRGHMMLGFGVAWYTCEFTSAQRTWSMVLGLAVSLVGVVILGWWGASKEPR